MHRFLDRRTTAIDRLLFEGRGGCVVYRDEWPTARFEAWRDDDGALTLWLWRFEFVFDQGGMHWAVRY